MPHWIWIALASLAILVVSQQFYIYRVGQKWKRHEEIFRIVTENAADMIALVDMKGTRLYNSPAYKRILGYSPAELGETSAFEQIHPEDRLKILNAAREARSTGVGKKVEYRIRHKNGSWLVLESVAGTIRNAKGDVDKLVIINRDITERKQAEERAEHNLLHDSLTGLANRRLFLDRLQNAFDRAQRSPDHHYAVLFIDLDGFKDLNTSVGRVAGDQIIIEVARRLEACLRDEDTVSRAQNELSIRNSVLSRMDGDEFTVLLEAVSDPSDALRVSQRILTAIAQPFRAGGHEVHSSASVGIALSTPGHKRAEDVLEDADTAMRRAKALGGARSELFDQAMHNRAVNRLKLESDLRQAMEKQEFRLHYQPIVALETRKITGFEALLRWERPGQGLISPYKFMAAAEDQGLLVSIGQWVFLQACRQLLTWDRRLPTVRDAIMSVNLSPSQLANAGFAKQVEETLARTGVDPARLRLEIREDAAAADARLTSSVAANLKRIGLSVILDDYGGGSSSLRGLRQFPLEAVKIDRSLIGAMLVDRAASEMVELIIFLAHKLKLLVIAAGIENAKQHERLRELQCDLGQGYLYSQPIDAESAEELLRQRIFVLPASLAAAK